MNAILKRYLIHLIDGTNIEVLENDETPYESSLINEYLHGENEFLLVLVGLEKEAYIPKKNILFVTYEGSDEGVDFGLIG